MGRKQRRHQDKLTRTPPRAGSAARVPAAGAAEALLSQAIDQHRAGRLAEAEALYRQALEREPGNTDALHLLGIVLFHLGDLDGAQASIQRALDRDPGFAAAWSSLGNLLRERGRHTPDTLWEAAAAYRRAIALKPGYADAYANLAATLHAAGKPEAAAAACRQALDIDADHLDAHYNLGFALRDLGQRSGAEAAFRRVTELNPAHVEARYRLGLLLQARGDLAGAEAAFRPVLERLPTQVDVLLALADTLQLAGRHQEAVAAYARAVDLRPGWAEAHNNLGVALHELGRLAEATEQFRRALDARPDYADAYSNLGRALQDMDRIAEAVACLQRAIDLRPDLAEAHANLGIAFKEQGRFAEAAACHVRALVLRPAYADAHANLGVALKELGRLDEAAACQRRALALDPGHAKALNNLGTLFQAQGDPQGAEACYARALEIDPRFALGHWNHALVLLGRGELEPGWTAYAWRFPAGQAKPWRRLPMAEWRGGSLAAKRILVWREQGIGDELMFASTYPDLIARAGQVVIECDRRLVTLFARSFPQAVVRAETSAMPMPDADTHAAAGTVARHLRPDLASFPERGAFLTADPERVARWRTRLAGIGPGLKVGICWRSRLLSGGRGDSYTGLRQWGPLFARRDIQVIRLQYDECEAEMRAAERRFGITIHRWADVDLMNDFDEVAALMTALDLVITGPTSVGELAGALGVPVWRMAWTGDWTSLGTGRRPWFPTMRLFYARAGQTFDDMLERMARSLPDNLSPSSRDLG